MNDTTRNHFFYFSLLLSLVIFSTAVFAQAGTWWGFVSVNGSGAANDTVVAAYCNNVVQKTTTTKTVEGSLGYYILDIECNSGDNVTFNVSGVGAYPTNETAQSWSEGYHTSLTTFFNISMNKLANGKGCSYSAGCTGGYCCSGATEYTDGSGTGTCQASACSAAATTTVAAAGGGAGGGGGATTTVATTTVATTTVVTTTTVPPDVTETLTVESIEAGEEGTFTIENEDELKIQEITVEVKNAVSDVQLNVTRTYTQPATVAIAAPGNVYIYLEIEKTNIADEDITKVTIKFKVEKSWITDNNIDESTITLNRYSDGVWSELTPTEVDEDDDYIYFEVESPGLSVFAITAEELPVTTTVAATTVATTTIKPVIPVPGRGWLFLIIIILVVGLIVFAYKKGFFSG